MKRRPRTRPLVAEINITPFTDVILVLLVIFMLATPLIYQSNIKVKLPDAKSAEPHDVGQVKQAVVSITSEGMVYLDEKVVTLKELKGTILSLKKANPSLNVYLRSDQQTRFRDVVDVLDIMSTLGISSLDIAATKVE
ncbi:MAG: biopolymer transporter ExbD [Candidatus Omnitrophota bacterium]